MLSRDYADEKTFEAVDNKNPLNVKFIKTEKGKQPILKQENKKVTLDALSSLGMLK